jgi:hypothetical protein
MPRTQQATPTLVFKSYCSTREQSRGNSAETSGSEGCEAFSTWVRQRLPSDSSLASLCDQLGREGSRGLLARRLLTTELTHRQLHVNAAMFEAKPKRGERPATITKSIRCNNTTYTTHQQTPSCWSPLPYFPKAG